VKDQTAPKNYVHIFTVDCSNNNTASEWLKLLTF